MMRLIDADKITRKRICSYLGADYASCVDDVVDLLNDQPEVYGNGEICEWRYLSCFESNSRFKVQCNHNPLKNGIVPNNFSYHDFKYCPFCGRKIAWMPLPEPYREVTDEENLESRR